MLYGSERERLTRIGALAARKLGFDRSAYLDAGENGIAMLVRDDVVMKVTTDGTEYVEALKIKGKKTKHLADVYGAWVINNPEHKGTYVITKEMVDVRNSRKIDQAKSELEVFWRNSDLDIITNETELDQYVHHYWHRHDGSALERIKQELADSTPQARWYFEQIIGLIDELKSYGITGMDWVGDEFGHTNLGLKNGNIAYYDIGYGETKQTEMNYLELENTRKKVAAAIQDIDRESFNVGL